ncbi:hypothetical protein LZ495_21440 [Yinghuangia sp. KLBMP8922]|uniref:Uncharacterized protein n=1 Tax=Yinghuangia soli TaxID=2908204 RepID=A0AA41Q1D5_9ACTN|nr:hypothetical protein [Yinghuangia soli]MCF2529765.1 hypothetical protein [Yinghuangia soli]
MTRSPPRYTVPAAITATHNAPATTSEPRRRADVAVSPMTRIATAPSTAASDRVANAPSTSSPASRCISPRRRSLGAASAPRHAAPTACAASAPLAFP